MDNTLLYLAGGLVVTESAGITNLSGSSESPGNSGGGNDGLFPGLQTTIAQLRGEAQSAKEAARYARLLAETAEGGREIITETERIYETVVEQVPVEVPDGNGNGDENFDFTQGGIPRDWWRYMDGNGETDPREGPTDTGKNNPEGYQFQYDYGGPGKEVVAGLGEIGHQGGQLWKDGEKFVGDNPYATAGLVGAVAASPFTGGTSLLAIAGAGGATEVGSDLVTGQHGDIGKAVDTAGKQLAGAADASAGSIDESIGRQFDDKKGGGFADMAIPGSGPLFGGGNGGGNNNGGNDTSPRPGSFESAAGPSIEEQKASEKARKDKGDGRVLPFGPTIKW